MGRIVKCRRFGCNNTFPKPEGRGRPQKYCRHACMIAAFRRRCKKGGQGRHAVETGAIEWYTPAVYIDAARTCMGNIDLDPASCEAANAIVQADRFYTLEDDGLVQPWVGRVWLNPPWTSKDMAGFVDRFAAHDHGCILVNTVTETKYGQILLQACPVVCFHAGRINFASPNGQKAGSGTVGQMIGYRGPTPETFADAFAPFGTILTTTMLRHAGHADDAAQAIL